MWLRRCITGAFGLLTGVAVAPVVHATYSIAATDSATQQVGGAVTSCVGTLDLSAVYGGVPGHGVIHAQAQLDQRLRGKNRAIQLLDQGVAPSEIIAQISASSLDPGFAVRQYGVVDVQGRADGFTGASAQAYRSDQQGSAGSFTYSVQGNILTSQRVLDQAATAFEGEACDLAERLMLALEAGGANGEGDSRCTSRGIPSDGAFIQVDQPGMSAGSYLRLNVSNTAPNNPLPRLRAMFDAWRKTHPCSPIVIDAGTADDAGAADPAPVAGRPAMGAAGRSSAGNGGESGARSNVAGATAGAVSAGVAGYAGVAASAGAAAISGGASAPVATSSDGDKGSGGCSMIPRARPCLKSGVLTLVLLSLVTLRRRQTRPRRL